MQYGYLRDPLSGFALSVPTRWPGRVKVESCPGEHEFLQLKLVPGVYSFRGKKGENDPDTGWFVPQNLIDAARLEANLEDYELDPYAKTPTGITLRKYQRRGTTFLRRITAQREGALLGADPGLGKCRHPRSFVDVLDRGPVRICDLPRGELVAESAVERVYRPAERLPVAAFTGDLCKPFAETEITAIYERHWSGPLYEVVCSNGFTDHVRGEHRLLQLLPDGSAEFTRADTLSVGAWLVLPKYRVQSKSSWSVEPHVLQLLAWWAADGGGHTDYAGRYLPPNITSHTELHRVARLARMAGLSPTPTSNGRTLVLGKAFGDMLLEAGVPVRTAGDPDSKRLATKLFSADRKVQANFLRHYFSRDGSITEDGVVEVTCKGRTMSQQVSALLNAFGISHSISTGMKRAKNGNGKPQAYHRITFCSLPTLQFLSNIGFDEAAIAVRRKHETVTKHEIGQRFLLSAARHGTNTNRDVVPVNGMLQQLREAAGVGFRRLGLRTDTARRVAGHSRARLYAALSTMRHRVEDAVYHDFETRLRPLLDHFDFVRVKSVRSVSCDTNVVMDIETAHGHSYTGGSAGTLVSHNTLTALQALWVDGFLQRPGLIVGPKICRPVWIRDKGDPMKHYGLKVLPVTGAKAIDPTVLYKHNCFFCHYEILKEWQPFLFAVLRPHWIIFDEIHYLSGGRTKRALAARQVSLCSSVERRIGLTGTPINNERLELWSQMAIVQPRQWGNTHFDFGIRWCAGTRLPPEQGGAWQFEGESNCEELRARLAGSFLRFTTEEVGDELPKLHRRVIDIDANAHPLIEEYRHAQRDIVGYLQDAGKLERQIKTITIGSQQLELSANDQKPGGIQLVCYTTLIGIASRIKREASLAAVSEILALRDKLVIFSWRKEMAHWLYCMLTGADMAKPWRQGAFSFANINGTPVSVWGPITSNTDSDNREKHAEAFADAEGKAVYIATLGSAGMSINNLKAATDCLMTELWWEASKLIQGEKRIHRDGNTASDVYIHYPVAHGTIDDRYIAKLQDKALAAQSLAKNDISGMNLVRDLSPASAREEYDFDVMLERLMATD